MDRIRNHDLFDLTLNLQNELGDEHSTNIITTVSGQRGSSGRWTRVEVQLTNEDNEIIYERVYPDRPSYSDVRDDYGPR